MKPRRPTRLDGFTYIGKHAYSLTICTFQRYRVFLDADFTRESIARLLITAKKFGFAVIAYCFMPDHVHLVVVGQRDDSALESFVKSLNTQLGYYWHQKTGMTLWQGGYRDDILGSDANLILAARYVVMNPVRAGLVDDPSQYEFTGSVCYTIAEIMDDGYGPATLLDKPKGLSPQECGDRRNVEIDKPKGLSPQEWSGDRQT